MAGFASRASHASRDAIGLKFAANISFFPGIASSDKVALAQTKA